MAAAKGDPVSGFLGALLMALITNGLYKWGLSTGGTYVMQGLVILLAMNFDGQFNRILPEAARAARPVMKGCRYV